MKKSPSTKLKIVLLAFVLAVSLTGCVDLDAHVTVNSDLSGSYEITFLTSDFTDRFLQGNDNQQENSLTEQLKQQGFIITEIKKEGQAGWKATKHVDSFLDESPMDLVNNLKTAYDWTKNQTASLQAVEGSTSSGSTTNSGVTTEWGLFTTTVNADFRFNLLEKNMLSDIPESFQNIFFDKMNLRFHLTLPVEATEHNATQVSEDGKTLTWKLDPTQENHIYLSKSLPNPITWGILLILAIIFLIVFLRKRKRRRASYH